MNFSRLRATFSFAASQRLSRALRGDSLARDSGIIRERLGLVDRSVYHSLPEVHGRTPESIATARGWMLAFASNCLMPTRPGLRNLDGDPPHPARLHPQAWSVAELLRLSWRSCMKRAKFQHVGSMM